MPNEKEALALYNLGSYITLTLPHRATKGESGDRPLTARAIVHDKAN